MTERAFFRAASPRRAARTLAATLLAAAALSCSSAPKSVAPPIGMEGEPKALEALVGRWEGTFQNPVTGRTGTIVFEVFSGKEAHGDILMIPPGSSEPLRPAAKPSAEETLRTMPKVLEINFFEAAGKGLTGTVGPYEDPECQCLGHTTFEGTLRGDSIAGTFQTEHLDADKRPDPSRPITSGTWRVVRTKKG
jgi:hypothetical protein